MISLFFVLRGSQTNRTLIRATGEDHFLLIILATLKLFFSKRWASKNCWGNFFGAFVRADFFRVHFVGRKSSEFFEP